MANENKNAPGSQGSGNQQGGDGQERPGHDMDIETEIPGREIPGAKDASHNPDQPGAGRSGMGYGGRGGHPEVDDPPRPRTPREAPSADDERQAKKRP